MTDFPTLSYTSTSKIPTVSYISEAWKRTHFRQSPLYRPLQGVPSHPTLPLVFDSFGRIPVSCFIHNSILKQIKPFSITKHPELLTVKSLIIRLFTGVGSNHLRPISHPSLQQDNTHLAYMQEYPDQLRFQGNSPPTPPLSQHYHSLLP